MATMRVAQVGRAGGAIELVERPIPEPGPGKVRLRVHACGVCHSDFVTKDGHMPGIVYPRVPGHEVAGVIDALGAAVADWQVGDRVGVGWHGGYCGHCEPCQRGALFACRDGLVTGVTSDGGYGEYMVAPASALARIPDGLSAVEAAPLLCAGVTTFNALRNSRARPGDLVAVHGLGGLGHLGVQFAARLGFDTVAIARGAEKAAFARQLGAMHYIDSQTEDPAAALLGLGGASAILATVTDGAAMAAVVGGLGIDGTMMLIGVPPSLTIAPFPLLLHRAAVRGWYSGTAIDSHDALAFAARTGVRSMNEVYPLEQAADGFDRMASGAARFRVVLAMP